MKAEGEPKCSTAGSREQGAGAGGAKMWVSMPK